MMDETTTTELVPVVESSRDLPPILVGRHTPAVEAQVRNFYDSVAQIFERWVTRRSSRHTQRAYRGDVLAFVAFLGIKWPEESTHLFTVSVADVLEFRGEMEKASMAPKTINRRIASLSNFFKYLQGVGGLPPSIGSPSRSPTRPMPSSSRGVV